VIIVGGTYDGYVNTAVVRVRGERGETTFLGPSKFLASVPGPHTAVNGTSRWKWPLQLTVGRQMFSEFLGPKIYTLTTGTQ